MEGVGGFDGGWRGVGEFDGGWRGRGLRVGWRVEGEGF